MDNTGELHQAPGLQETPKGCLAPSNLLYLGERAQLNLEGLPDEGGAEAVHWPKPILLVGFILKVSQEVVGHEVLTPCSTQALARMRKEGGTWAGSRYLCLLWVLAMVLKARAWLLCPPGFSTESVIADIKTGG